MLDFHHERARALLANATQIVTPLEVQAAVTTVADRLNAASAHPAPPNSRSCWA